jgi:biopolymer transport protein ExbB
MSNSLICFTLLQAQSAVADLVTNPVATAPDEQLDFIELAMKGGLIMWPLLALSVIAVFIFFERYGAIRRALRIDQNFMNTIRMDIAEERLDAAVSLCQRHDSPIARMIEKGIKRIGCPLSDIQTAIENVGNVEVARLEKGLTMLATVAGGGPMLGFLGTTTGMIRAFFDMQAKASNLDISTLAGGIYEALVTTVAGLIVGVIAYFGYNFLSSRISTVVNKLENTTVEFMDILYYESDKSSAAAKPKRTPRKRDEQPQSAE